MRAYPFDPHDYDAVTRQAPQRRLQSHELTRCAVITEKGPDQSAAPAPANASATAAADADAIALAAANASDRLMAYVRGEA